MRTKFIPVIIFILLTNCASGQATSRVNKYSIGIEIDAGHSFPNYIKNQDRWKGSFYPAGALTISIRNRINRHWQTDLGIGITGYALVNSGPYDNYILDFASPHLVSSIQYIKINGKTKENFFRLKSGMQLGYTQEFSESFDSYEVTIKGADPIYFFIRPEIGIRNQFKKKINGFNLGYELGVFYRYNLNGLGRAEFLEPDYLTIVQPKGDIIGMYFNIVFPVGRQKMKIEEDNKKSDKKIISRPKF